MPKRKLTKHEDDIRRGLRSPDSVPPYGKLRKSAENSTKQSPHDGIHTCSRGCSKPGCNRALRDTIDEQNLQIEALKRDLLEATADKRKKAMEAVHDLNQIGGLQEENARLKAEVERLTKAGDEMADNIVWIQLYQPIVAKWNAAKEGKSQP